MAAGIFSTPFGKQDPFVGSSPSLCLKIDGIECNSTPDTGSQISTVQLDLFNQKIRPVLEHGQVDDQDLRVFNVRAANGMALPYSSYFVATVECNGQRIPDCGFLVVPNKSKRAPVLLGTNILQRIPDYMKNMEALGIKTADHASARRDTSCELQEVTPETLGFARMDEPGNTYVPANSISYLRLRGKKNVSAEFDPSQNLPSGLVIPSGYIKTSQGATFNVPVFNWSHQDVVIKNNARLGILRSACTVPKSIDVNCSDNELVVSSDERPSGPSFDASTRQTKDAVDHFDGEVQRIIKDFPGTKDERNSFVNLLLQYRSLFSSSDTDMGTVDMIQHRIHTTDDIPVNLPYRRVSPAMLKELKEHLDLLRRQGIIRESESDYASPIVLCRKKDGRLRMCCDFRALNSKTIRDAHPLPRIQESLDSICGSKYFSTLDLKSAYNQVPVHENDIHKTAFTTPFGLYEHLRMPFGLKNAPACFQRLMNTVLRRELFEILICYLDDILIFGSTISEKLERLSVVFERLHSRGLKLELKKCTFFQIKVKYLGYEISQEGIGTDPCKIDAVKKWPHPTTLKELRTFLGFTSYYRRYVPGFTQKARPLHRLVADLNKIFPGKRRKNAVKLGEHWTNECKDAFETIRTVLTTAPVLAYPRYGESFILETDSSEKGLGAVLYQLQDGKKRIIAYASRGLRGGEANKSNYSSKKLELLALKWACEHFREFLIGSKFTVYTDNNPLTHVKETKKLSALEQRWVNFLSAFDFDLKFKSGITNAGADALSRIKHRQEPDMTSEEVDSCLLDASITTLLTPELRKEVAEIVIESLEVDEMEFSRTPALGMPTIQPQEMFQLQQEDDVIKRLIHYRTLGRRPNCNERRNEEKPVLQLIRQWDRIVQQPGGPLFRKVIDNHGDKIHQLVLPACLQKDILHALHDDACHQAVERTEQLIRTRCYWPAMSKDIEQYVKQCYRCNESKKPYHQIRTPLGRLVASKPLECIALDFTVLEPSSDGRENVLVITDVFTKFTVAFASRDQKASTVARLLSQEWFFRYGIPLRIHSDMGRNFESSIIRELCKVYGIRKSSTTPYHPESNSLCERFNRTLHNLLRTLGHDKKRQWAKYLHEAVHAYNTTIHSSTGYSPFYLMFLRECRLPIDLVLGTRSDLSDGPTEEWVSAHHERITTAYRLAKDQIDKEADRRKRLYDRSAKPHTLSPGTLVFLRKRVPGRSKIADAWGTRLFKVVQRQGENDVYIVQPVDGFGKQKTLNRRELRECQAPDWNPELPVREDKQRSDDNHRRPVRQTTTYDSSDSESDLIIVHPTPEPTAQLPRPVPERAQLTSDEQEHESSTDSNSSSDVEERSDVGARTDSNGTGEDPEVTLRRSTRRTAGYHSNPLRLPRSACP